MQAPVELQNRFDAERARAALVSGNNKITGSALLQQQGGGIVTCAGNQIVLIPATPYAVERMVKAFGDSTKGFASVWKGLPTFVPDPPEFQQATRSVSGDAQGNFEFDSVADGDYFVLVKIMWMVGYTPQGGTLMQRVRVSGGEVKRIVLSG